MQAGRWRAWLVLGSSLVANVALAEPLLAEPLNEVAGAHRVCRAGADRAVAQAQRALGEAAVAAAQVLPNPSLVVQHQRTLSGAPDRETVVGLSVPLGLGGRRWLLQDAAEARRKQAGVEARATLFEAALAFREAYVVASVDQARAQVLTEQQRQLDALSVAIQKLAQGGEAAGYDSLRQLTQARLHRQSLESARARAQASRAVLEVWLEREVTLPAGAVLATAPGRLLPATGREAPRIESLRAEASAGELEALAARRSWVPELALFAGYRSVAVGSETGHGVALSVELPLTLFDRGQGEAARADAEVELALSLAGRLRQQHRAQLKAAQASLRLLEPSLAGALGAARGALEVRDKAAQLYTAGEANITELLEAFSVAEEAQLASLALAQDIALTRLALMRAAGTMFDAALDRECRGAAR